MVTDIKPNSVKDIQDELQRRCVSQELNYNVGPDGSFGAEIAIIAEAPGVREIELGRPLVGGSGNYLWDNLRQLGIDRRQCYITNVVKRQVSMATKGNARNSVPKGELVHWQSLVQWELQQLPNVRWVLLLGNYALNAFLGENGITNWRGTVREDYLTHWVESGDGIRVPRRTRKVHFICTFNPAAILREPKMSPIFRFDLNKLQRVMDGKWKPTEVNAHINPTRAEAVEWIHKMRNDGLPVGWDIETISEETACHGLANTHTEGMCINFRNRDENVYSRDDEIIIRKELNNLFHDPKVRLVTQNGMFDSSWTWYKERMRIQPIWFDTMLAHHLIYPMFPHNLGFITTQYTDNPFYKDEGKSWKEGGNIDQFWTYNVKDCCHMIEAMGRMHTELRQQGLEDFFFQHVMRLQPELVKMTVLGVKIDTKLKHELTIALSEDLEKMKQDYYAACQEATGKDSDYKPNPDSVPQTKMLLFTYLKLVGKGTSTDQENRQRMRKNPHTNDEAKGILDLYDAYKRDKKFYSTYATMRIDDDGRVRSEYKQTGVANAPGRLSSAATAWGSGTNLQNQPQRAYPLFVADEGFEFNYFDLSGAEARVVAHLAKIDQWIEDFHKADTLGKDQFDPHRATAAQVFNVPYDEIPKHDRLEYGKTTDDPKRDGEITLRFIGKRCKHGLNYRMSAQRLHDTLLKEGNPIPMSMAIRAYDAYHRAYPEIKQWWEETTKEVYTNKMLWSPFGRRLLVTGRIDDDSALESIVAFKPQSAIGDFVASRIYKIHNDPKFPRHQARVVLNIHDALIVLNRIGFGKQVRSIMAKHAREPIMINGNPVVIPPEMKVSRPGEDGIHRWSTLKDIEEGL